MHKHLNHDNDEVGCPFYPPFLPLLDFYLSPTLRPPPYFLYFASASSALAIRSVTVWSTASLALAVASTTLSFAAWVDSLMWAEAWLVRAAASCWTALADSVASAYCSLTAGGWCQWWGVTTGKWATRMKPQQADQQLPSWASTGRALEDASMQSRLEHDALPP